MKIVDYFNTFVADKKRSIRLFKRMRILVRLIQEK